MTGDRYDVETCGRCNGSGGRSVWDSDIGRHVAAYCGACSGSGEVRRRRYDHVQPTR